MSAPHRTSRASGHTQTNLRFTATLHDERWGRERDTRFARFVAQRLADVEATGCLAERKLAAGLLDLYTEWHHRRELAAASQQDPATAEADAMGWALRCLAHSAWVNTPGWEPAFHPAATAPIARSGGHVPALRP
ncbi:hypothetical protein [Streptomyces stelliscabiei]|uniref:hypothetical protein n=1 Tax=Streptomyces stelliscabiei TaxID=146820 RepID=UPI0029A8A8E1|nr:hypothetical protein [Streptomyces stelliscabiei]MDX3435699.1 hypothetical protein [Streptomyces stelliscabiei]MDX3622002.1 hypothetical protein [Streptomyces stelliscabiei]